jgi:hypothetical protein
MAPRLLQAVDADERAQSAYSQADDMVSATAPGSRRLAVKKMAPLDEASTNWATSKTGLVDG